MLFDSAKVSEAFVIAHSSYCLPGISARLASDYTLTKLNCLTSWGYGLVVALFTLSPEPHGAEPKT